MSSDIEQIVQSKCAERRRLLELSWLEKLEMLAARSSAAFATNAPRQRQKRSGGRREVEVSEKAAVTDAQPRATGQLKRRYREPRRKWRDRGSATAKAEAKSA